MVPLIHTEMHRETQTTQGTSSWKGVCVVAAEVNWLITGETCCHGDVKFFMMELLRYFYLFHVFDNQVGEGITDSIRTLLLLPGNSQTL